MTDPFIKSLTEDLKPVKPLKALPMMVISFVLLALSIIYVWFVLSPRPALADIGLHPELLTPMVIIKPLIFLGLAFVSGRCVLDLARPEGRLQWGRIWPIVLGVLILIVLSLSDLLTLGPKAVAQSLDGGVDTCGATIGTGGILIFGALWWGWLRKTATLYPITFGVMSAIFAASLIGCAYALHCPMDASAYILVIYGGVVSVLAVLGGLIGARLFQW